MLIVPKTVKLLYFSRFGLSRTSRWND